MVKTSINCQFRRWFESVDLELLGKYSNKSRTTAELEKLLEMAPEGPPPRHQTHLKRRRPSSAASGNVCAFYQFTKRCVLSIAIPPDDVATDHRVLLFV